MQNRQEITQAGKVKIRLALKVLFFFFGTFLHEFAHYVAAMFFGKPTGFSVIPKVSGDDLVFGSVKARTRYRVFSSLIAAAPLAWWFILILFLAHLRVMITSVDFPAVHVMLSPGRLRFFSPWNILFLWLAIQLLWAGRLSSQDIRTFFSGIFSPSGALLCSATAILFFVISRVRPWMSHLL